jgi:lipopolysaccharide export system permease protein
MSYHLHGVRISEGEPPDVRPGATAFLRANLWGSDDIREIAELQWRLSMPLMVITLGLIAIPSEPQFPA